MSEVASGVGQVDPPSRFTASFRFYGELADFLPTRAAGEDRLYHFTGKPSVKDAIEAQGVPHPEVNLILADGESVGFDHHLGHGERIAVFPPFRSFDISSIACLAKQPTPKNRFAIDVNLGKLARWLRLLGFDAAYRNDLHARKLVELAVEEDRILLTRNRRLLRHRELDHGYWVRADRPDVQVAEVLQRFRIEAEARPFQRCTTCNGRIRPVPKETVIERLEPLTRENYETFYQCEQCGRIYWRGSHYQRLIAKIDHALSS